MRRCLIGVLCAFALPAFGQLPTTEAEKTVANNRARADRVVIDETVMLVDGAPFFCRSIQHNGEPFEFLRSLGFNTIQLSAPATDQQLQDADRIGVWIVCPPPASTAIRNISAKHDSVLAWSIGEDLVGRDRQIVRQTVDQIRDADKRASRPVVGNIDSDWQSLIPLVDITSVGVGTVGSSFPVNRYSNWLDDACHKQQSQLKPLWADLQTELPLEVNQQVELIAGELPPLPVQREQLKFVLYEAITGGARGIRFLSRSRLDATDPATQLRMSSVDWLLRHLDQIAPFAAAGAVQQVNEVGEQNELEVHLIKSVGSELMLIQRTTGFEQWCCGDVLPKTVNIPFDSVVGQRLYRLDEQGATLMSGQRSRVNLTLEIPDCPYAACVLATQDPNIVRRVSSVTANNEAAIQLRFKLTQQWLAYLHLCENQIAATGHGDPFIGVARERAESDLRNAQQMLNGSNMAKAVEYLNKADSRIASAGRQLIMKQHQQSNGVVSTPMLQHFGLLPIHLAMNSALAGQTWGPNSLTAGGFENLEHMTNAGWKNHREESNGLSTKVELSKQAAVNGTYGLKLSTTIQNQMPIQIQSKPLWIKSAPVKVKEGQLVRIHGFANISHMALSHEGLIITDSIGHKGLATRIQPTQGWQEFTIYRVAERDSEFSVTLAMTGIGEAMIDEVTIRTIDLPGSNAQAKSGSVEIK